MANLLSFATVNQISTDLGISLMSRHHRRLVINLIKGKPGLADALNASHDVDQPALRLQVSLLAKE
jgi:hypothetical protein